MKRLFLVVSLVCVFRDVAFGSSEKMEIECIVSLAQQKEPGSESYGVDSLREPITFKYNSNEGSKTVLLTTKVGEPVNSRMPDYELKLAAVGETPDVAIVLEYNEKSSIVGPTVAVEMSTETGKSESVGFSIQEYSYSQSVVTKLSPNLMGLVVLACVMAGK